MLCPTVALTPQGESGNENEHIYSAVASEDKTFKPNPLTGPWPGKGSVKEPSPITQSHPAPVAFALPSLHLLQKTGSLASGSWDWSSFSVSTFHISFILFPNFHILCFHIVRKSENGENWVGPRTAEEPSPSAQGSMS